MTALHVLLITNRPAVHAFLEEHGARSIPHITATQLPLATEGLDQHARDVHDPQVAMIDVGADPDAAVAVAQALHRQRPDLRVLAVRGFPRPTKPWPARFFLCPG